MPLRESQRTKFAPLDLPYIQFTRDVQFTTSRNKPIWPTTKRLQELSTSLCRDDFFTTSISKTGLGVARAPTLTKQHESVTKKLKPFSFSLQQKREFPWSNKASHDFARRSYEKPNKRTFRLPVDPVSRLVWDERVAPLVAHPDNSYYSNNDPIDEADTISDKGDGDGAFRGPSTSINLGMLPLLQQSKCSPRRIPANLKKLIKSTQSNSMPAATTTTTKSSTESIGNNAPVHFNTKEKHWGTGCISPLEFLHNPKTGLPELKETERRRPHDISRYHAHCYDSDDELDSSWTLPRIEMVLQSEGVEPGSIMHQIEKIRSRKSREYDQERRLKLKRVLQHRKLAEEVKVVHKEVTEPNLTEDPENSRAKEEIAQYYKDIENIRWISQQQIERSVMVPGFPLPRIVLISSQIPEATKLISAVKNNTILPIVYHYKDETFLGILRGIRLRLDEYQSGYFMKSLLLYCLGGPGYMYLLNKRIITRQKLEGRKHRDMSKFFGDLGALVSKVDPKQAFIHLAGGQWPNVGEKTEFIDTLKAKSCPSRVHYECIDEQTLRGEEVFNMYFNHEKYLVWKAGSDNVTDDIREDTTETGRPPTTDGSW